ncbi:beta-lactamase family protein [Bacillus sp. NP157]|nr:beta-lactamase family protein [Bacillus sp. NP157]
MPRFAWLVTAWFCLGPAHAATPPAWKAQADAVVAALPANAPGASIAVVDHGRVVYESARGLASVELNVPLTPASVLRIGSLTKTVTAATVMRLVSQGKLGLDAPIARWLPDFPHADQITTRQLLSHTSGVSDRWTAPLAEPLDTAGRLKLIAATPLDFAPGTDWRYSNSGYMVLGAIIEKVTGKPWADAERELAVAPLGIDGVAYHGDADVVARFATGYTLNDGGKVAKPILYSITGPGAAGALSATASGMGRWLHGLATDKAFGPGIFASMSTPARIGDVELPYGLGMVPGQVQGVAVSEHSGGIEGYLAYYVYVPSTDLAVVVLENSDAPAMQARSLARRLAALALGKPYRTLVAQAWSASQLQGIAGSYAIPGGGMHVIEVRDGAAWIHRDNGPPKRLATCADDTLAYTGDGIAYLRVMRDAKGAATGIDFHDDGVEQGRREGRVLDAGR